MEYLTILKKSYPDIKNFIPIHSYLEAVYIKLRDGFQQNILTCFQDQQIAPF
jgi:hypothetical protein